MYLAHRRCAQFLALTVTRMRSKGKITNWKDDRGFGFITPSNGGDRVFVHVSAFIDRSRRPTQGETVTYEVRRDERGRPRAENVSRVGEERNPPRETASFVRASLGAGLFLTAIAVLTLMGTMPAVVFGLYVVASIVALVAYGSDKSAARKNRWRTPEGTLHLLGLVGGWPGALVAQHAFRHKTSKRSFVISFWITVLLNCSALVWLLASQGQKLLAWLSGAP